MDATFVELVKQIVKDHPDDWARRVADLSVTAYGVSMGKEGVRLLI